MISASVLRSRSEGSISRSPLLQAGMVNLPIVVVLWLCWVEVVLSRLISGCMLMLNELSAVKRFE